MRHAHRLTGPTLGLILALPAVAADVDKDGFVPMFNGRDLTGWVNVNCHPGTFYVKGDEIITTGQPIGFIRTERMYENFILELEWMHVNKDKMGNSGVFVWGDGLPGVGSPFTRGVEVQVLVNYEADWATSHGDVFSIQGATCKPDRPHPKGQMRCLPSERRAKGGGEWNHYRIVAKDGVIKLSVNGKEVSGVSECNPRKGYLALESEGAVCHFRNVRIKELPGSNPKPDQVAASADGFVSLFTGLDLGGWKDDPGHKGHWQARNGALHYDGKSEAKDKNLWSGKEYGDFELVADWRLPAKNAKKMMRPVILPSGDEATDPATGKPKQVEVMDAGDSGIYLRGDGRNQVNIWCWPAGSGELWSYRTDKTRPPEVRAAATPRKKADKKPGEWNRFHITMKGDRLTVNLNGETVIDNARLPGVKPRGPIALQHHGDEIEFDNIYVRELR